MTNPQPLSKEERASLRVIPIASREMTIRALLTIDELERELERAESIRILDYQKIQTQERELERTQRLADLVRQQRMELFTADLINEDEYAELAKDHPAVARLESYDSMRREITRLREALKVYADECNFAEGNDWYWVGDDDPKTAAQAALREIGEGDLG